LLASVRGLALIRLLLGGSADKDRRMPDRPAAQQERERLQARRLRAGELFAVGVRQAEIARQLGVSRQAVSLWHAAWQTGGTQALPRDRG
jgi:DNA invertase Pin-like site-specific DNA recombinase